MKEKKNVYEQRHLINSKVKVMMSAIKDMLSRIESKTMKILHLNSVCITT